jgi:hypothetical protein
MDAAKRAGYKLEAMLDEAPQPERALG